MLACNRNQPLHAPDLCMLAQLPALHFCRYYFRRLVQSLLDQQKAAALAALPRCDLLHAAAALPAAEAGQQQEQQQGEDARAASAGEPASWTAEQAAAVKLLTAAVTSHRQAGAGADPPPIVCAVVATLAARSAQHLLEVLLHLARQQPELAAHLLLHSLDPAGWELLSGAIERRQEELAAESGWLGEMHGVQLGGMAAYLGCFCH